MSLKMLKVDTLSFVEDIIDTGQTLKSLRDMFTAREAASVKIVTMLDKPEGRTVEIEADYTLFYYSK